MKGSRAPRGRAFHALLSLGSSYLNVLVSTALALLLAPVILRHIGPVGYGAWAVIGSVVAYLGVADFGIGATLTRFVAHSSGSDGNKIVRLVSNAFLAYLVVSAVTVAGGLLVLWKLPLIIGDAYYKVSGVRLAVSLIVFTVACNFPLSVFASALRGLQRQYLSDIVAVGVNVTNVLLNVWFLRRGLGIVSLAAPNAVLVFVQGMVLWRLARRYGIRVSWYSRDPALIRTLLGFSVYLFVNSVAVLLVFNTDNIVTGLVVGSAAVATYQLTYRPGQLLTRILMLISDAAFPGITEIHGSGNTASFRRSYLQVLGLTVAVSLPFAVLYVVFSRPFITLWVGPSSYGGMTLALAFGYLIIAHSFLHVSALVLQSCGSVRGVAWMSLLEGLVNLVLSIFLAQAIGIVGVAFGTVIANVLTSGWYVPLAAAKTVGVSGREVFASIAKPVAIAMPFGALSWLIVDRWPPGGIVVLFAEAAGLLLVYAAAYWVGGLQADQRQRYVGLLRRALAR